MRRECRECFQRHRLQWKSLVSDTGMHHGTCVTHGPWCMSGSLTHGGGQNVPSIPGACTTRNFMYLARDPWKHVPHLAGLACFLLADPNTDSSPASNHEQVVMHCRFTWPETEWHHINVYIVYHTTMNTLNVCNIWIIKWPVFCLHIDNR